MTLWVTLFGRLRRFTGQVVVSLAATVCATAICGHFISGGGSLPAEPAANSARLEGGVIESRNVAYYPEHLAALDSLNRFRPLSVQRTAELAGELRSTRVASAFDAARPHRESADVLPARASLLRQATVLPPRRPVTVTSAPAPTPAPLPVAANPAEPTSHYATIWGVELPRFVPTGAAVMDKLTNMKDRIGGLIHVSSR